MDLLLKFEPFVANCSDVTLSSDEVGSVDLSVEVPVQKSYYFTLLSIFIRRTGFNINVTGNMYDNKDDKSNLNLHILLYILYLYLSGGLDGCE